MSRRYVYDHKGRKVVCPACGHRGKFRRFVDTKTGNLAPEQYGICDRKDSCGYNLYPPREGDNYSLPSPRHTIQKMKVTSWRCPQNLVDATLDHRFNTFAWWMATKFGEPGKKAMRDYMLGTYPQSARHPHLSGAAIFWQIGHDGQRRSGKTIPYGPDGKRIKDLGATWIHSVAYPGKSMEDLGIGQVLFGTHLLSQRPGATVAIVESEKTAMVMAALYPDQIWLATGGSHGLTLDKCMCLAGSDVVLFPDRGMFEDWSLKGIDLEPMLESLRVSDVLEEMDVPMGDDLADHLDDLPDLFPAPKQEVAETYVMGTGFVEVEEKPAELSSPVSRILALPGVSALVEELQLDTSNITIKSLTDGTV